ncbi:MAG: hypothetical protein HYY06_29455 [Deltaproteobacteria bacterium]|nr:hypothetical protein [Deltaproteobacteria bacterium]
MLKDLSRIFGAVNLAYGVALGVIILEVLPARHMVVDVLGTVSSLVLLASGLALLARAPWARRAGQAAAGVLLAFGMIVLVGIILSIGFLHGIYGAVGEGGTAVLSLLVALLVPYLLVLPIVELAHFRRLASGT